MRYKQGDKVEVFNLFTGRRIGTVVTVEPAMFKGGKLNYDHVEVQFDDGETDVIGSNSEKMEKLENY